MTRTREQIARSTAERLAAGTPAHARAVVGLDGFVDQVVAVVDRRLGPGHFEPVRTIAAMAEKVRAAAGLSSLYEMVVKQVKLGGNAPILAHALARLGVGVTCVGSLGEPEVHPAFRDLAAEAEVLSLAEPGQTLALEFDDGKLMLAVQEPLGAVSWEHLRDRVGADRLRDLIDGADLLALVNWSELPHMSGVWRGLRADVVPALSARPRTLLIDLADPSARDPAELRGALGLLGPLQGPFDVVLGLNLNEARQVAAALGGPAPEGDGAALAEAAAALRTHLGIGGVVIHPRAGAAAATAAGSAWFAGPFVLRPALSTGAGDHFNAGFALGRLLGLDLEGCLCAGAAVSGFYVRTGRSPAAGELAAFVAALPGPEG